jgi:general secretion pathway protein F
MQAFDYVAVDTGGHERRGRVEAAGEDAARALLQRRRLLPVRLVQSDAATRTTASRTPNIALSKRDRLKLTRQLAVLVDAAIPLDQALRMLASEAPNARMGLLAASVADGVEEGMTLAMAMARHGGTFDGMYRAAVAGGERTATLGAVLHRLADHLERDERVRTKVTTALIYPAVLSIVAGCVVIGLMTFVVPVLAQQFEGMDQDLPTLTIVLVAIANGLRESWWALGLLVVAAILGARMALGMPGVRAAWHGLLLRLPLLGTRVRDVHAARVLRSLGTMIRAGVPVLDAVTAARGATGHMTFVSGLQQAAEAVRSGESLSRALRAGGIFPPMAVHMIASGEAASDVPGMCDKAAEGLEREFEAFTDTALALLEPLIIVVMGAIVATIILAIMLPILQMNALVTG